MHCIRRILARAKHRS